MTINNKGERNYRGKCLGWPVTSYGAVRTCKVSVFRSQVTFTCNKVTGVLQLPQEIKTRV